LELLLEPFEVVVPLVEHGKGRTVQASHAVPRRQPQLFGVARPEPHLLVPPVLPDVQRVLTGLIPCVVDSVLLEGLHAAAVGANLPPVVQACMEEIQLF